MPIRLLIADDDQTIRLLFRRLLENHDDWQVCGEAANGSEAFEKAQELAPDVVILDLAMPVMNGMEAAKEILRINPQIPILLVSVQEVSKELAQAARSIGFRGAVTKSSGSEVVCGVEALLNKKTFFILDPKSEFRAD